VRSDLCDSGLQGPNIISVTAFVEKTSPRAIFAISLIFQRTFEVPFVVLCESACIYEVASFSCT
jgi:hypothetical protein